MEKETQFFWGWRGYEPQPDPTMCRIRAARLLRAWRRSKTQGVRDFSVKRLGKGRYQIASRGFEDEPSTMVILKNN